ncbi:MAG: SRPBCC domain-containing protein [Cyclobacteriaceae bacterium]
MAYSQSDKTITTEIEIEGSLAEVWEVLVDLEKWERWNPFIIQCEGQPIQGSKIKNTMISGGKKMVFKPRVQVVQKQKEFTWVGHLYIPGLFDGRHRFLIKEVGPSRVLLTQDEQFSGLLSGIILRKIGEDTIASFEKMNEALKAEVERRRGESSIHP